MLKCQTEMPRLVESHCLNFSVIKQQSEHQTAKFDTVSQKLSAAMLVVEAQFR